MDQTRLGVGIVGTGRVGAVMGRALMEAGHAVVGCTATSEASRERVAAMLPDVPILDTETVVERSELVLLTVPDDDLPNLVAGLAKLGRFNAGQIVAHCAGRYGVDILQPATDAGAIPLALHPSLSFTGTSIDLPRLRHATIAVTAPKPVLPIGQALVVEIGAEPIVVPAADRPLYHAAISHAANHTVVILSQALDMLAHVGVEEPAQVLHSLVDASVNNTLQTGPGALTGPVSRGDIGTVEAHLQALGEYAVTAGGDSAGQAGASAGWAGTSGEGDGVTTLATYVSLARATTARALRNGSIDQATAARLLALLDGSAGGAGGGAGGGSN